MALSPAVRVQGKVGHDLARSLLSVLDVYTIRSEDMVQQLNYVAAQFDRVGFESEDQGLTKALELAKSVLDTTGEVWGELNSALMNLQATDMYSPTTTNDDVMEALKPLDHVVNECYGLVSENTQNISGIRDASHAASEDVAHHRHLFEHNDVVDTLDYVTELCRIIAGDGNGAPTEDVALSLIDGYDGIRSMSVEVD